MLKKPIILCIMTIVISSLIYTYYNHSLLAATAINVIEEGEQVIIGEGDNGKEAIWTVSKISGNQYTMYHTAGEKVQMCNASTNNNRPSTNPSYIINCDFYTTVSGKSHSGPYLVTKAFNDAYGTSILNNTYESAAVQPLTGTSGSLDYVFLPKIAQIISEEIGTYDVLPTEFYLDLTDLAYVKHNYNMYSVAFSKTNTKQQSYPSASSTTPYPAYIMFLWAYAGDSKNWTKHDVEVFSYMDKSNMLYVLNSDIHKEVLTANPRAGVLKIRYSDPSYTVAFSDIKHKGNP